eukprot:SAG31_NODE_3818_length_3853_cov_10.567395_2_plen_188_part_00
MPRDEGCAVDLSAVTVEAGGTPPPAAGTVTLDLFRGIIDIDDEKNEGQGWCQSSLHYLFPVRCRRRTPPRAAPQIGSSTLSDPPRTRYFVRSNIIIFCVKHTHARAREISVRGTSCFVRGPSARIRSPANSPSLSAPFFPPPAPRGVSRARLIPKWHRAAPRLNLTNPGPSPTRRARVQCAAREGYF